MRYIFLLSFALLVLISCKKDEPISPTPPTYQEWVSEISLAKARYAPGESISLDVRLVRPFQGTVEVVYRHLSEIVDQESLSVGSANFQLSWQSPAEDFRGYMVEMTFLQESTVVGHTSVAIDVSSDWTRFPRYGFLSKFEASITPAQAGNTLDFLTRLHINGLQYYDWHYKHHLPLPMQGTQPASSWLDIANRPISLETVKTYLSLARQRNMASMSYNLLYGVWEDYAEDGVSDTWLMYNDPNQQDVNRHELDDNWAQSDILLTDPSNPGWQEHIFDQTERIYQYLDFDGWHLDQLGNRGQLFDHAGNKLSLAQTYPPFLNALHDRFTDKTMVLNAVNQYAQANILTTPVDFAYTEVWPPNETYEDLATIITYNESRMGQAGQTVLAAYMNYDLADQPGTFNAPAVLMTDAVIMAFGGAHLEWGEHMLGKEYFPNDNLQVSPELRNRLITYYDFMTAYQNVLREGEPIDFEGGLSSTSIPLTEWPGSTGSVVTFSRKVGDRTVYHLLNLSGLTSLDWRDNSGTQREPSPFEQFAVELPVEHVNKALFASPDYQAGHAVELSTQPGNGSSKVVIPYLHYWSILIVE